MHHSIDFSKYQLNAQFFYSSTIYMLHYAPQHVSSSTLLIIRRTNCITTTSGIITLCKQPYSMRVESGLTSARHLSLSWANSIHSSQPPPTINVPKYHGQFQCTLQILCEDRVLFVWSWSPRFFMRATATKMRARNSSRVSTILFQCNPTLQACCITVQLV